MRTNPTSPKQLLPVLSILVTILAIGELVACHPAQAPRPAETPLAPQLVVYSTPEDKMAAVYDAFTRETGVKVTIRFYELQDQAIDEIRAGAVYDVVTLDIDQVPAAVAEGLLATIDYRNVSNFKNISADFRNLTYDPDNKYSIPYSWGATGLVVRGDRVAAPITRWADLWDPRYVDKTVGWLLPRWTLAAVLKSLGYSANSEDPAQLEEALQRLLVLKPNATWLTGDQESIAPELVDGDAAFGLGWSFDYVIAHEQNATVTYVLPKEGALLWIDNFVIPANSPNKTTAELFLNFLLRPEISGQLANATYYAIPNDAAAPYVDPAFLNDPAIYPTNQELENSEILLPLSLEGRKLYAEIWDRFVGSAESTTPAAPQAQ